MPEIEVVLTIYRSSWDGRKRGTSVLMIENYYGHITPAKNAERILQGIPGWEPMAGGGGEPTGSVNADGAGAKPAKKPRNKK